MDTFFPPSAYDTDFNDKVARLRCQAMACKRNGDMQGAAEALGEMAAALENGGMPLVSAKIFDIALHCEAQA